MYVRKDKITEEAVKKGVEMSMRNFRSAVKLMTKAKVPYKVIDRVLFEPHKIRSTDLR